MTTSAMRFHDERTKTAQRPLLDLTVASRPLTEQILTRPSTFTHLISLRDSGTPPPVGIEAIPRRIELEVDVALPSATDCTPPRREHIERLLAWTSSVLVPDLDRCRLLVQCEQGLSRSTAAALIVLSACGSDSAEAWRHVLQIRPRAIPNVAMLRFARDLGLDIDAWPALP